MIFVSVEVQIKLSFLVVFVCLCLSSFMVFLCLRLFFPASSPLASLAPLAMPSFSRPTRTKLMGDKSEWLTMIKKHDQKAARDASIHIRVTFRTAASLRTLRHTLTHSANCLIVTVYVKLTLRKRSVSPFSCLRTNCSGSRASPRREGLKVWRFHSDAS